MKRMHIALALSLAALSCLVFFDTPKADRGVAKEYERVAVAHGVSMPQQPFVSPHLSPPLSPPLLPLSSPPLATHASPLASPPKPLPTTAFSQSGDSKKNAIDPVLALQARPVLIGGAHDGAPNALFGSQTWAPPPPPPIVVKPRPPLPPVSPPLPFTYLGKQIADGRWQVFLAHGEQTIIAVEQMIIDGTYRVDAIVPPQINFVYLPLQKMQTLSIGGDN